MRQPQPALTTPHARINTPTTHDGSITVPDTQHHDHTDVHLYDAGAEHLIRSDQFPDRVSLLPGRAGPIVSRQRIRVLWGQDMLRDALDGRYRAIVCGVNDVDNSHGIVAQLVNLLPSSQWREASVTSYAKMFQEAVSIHASEDREPFVLKYDLDSVLVLALLRPKGRDHFRLQDLARGFQTVSNMLQGRRERLPVATVSFLGARSNRLVDASGKEPSFEAVLSTMFEAGYRGDAYPAPQMWSMADVGVFPTFPFPESLERMREGGD